MEKYDLHCHSTASDGSLTPTQLIQRAQQQGVTVLALTDHDTINGLAEARLAAENIGLRLIPGIELSTTWENKCFHIVGLNIDPQNALLIQGINQLQYIRRERALKIADKLHKKNISGAYDAVVSMAGESMVTRLHFANYLLAQKKVESHQQAFDRYLGQGKSAYVSTVWASLEEAVEWIKASGGIAVLAHPLRYKLTAKWMKRALTAFKQAGGQGLEVVTGRSSPDDIHRSLHYAQLFELLASQGSDFHSPDNQWIELGRLAPMPRAIRPVWELIH